MKKNKNLDIKIFILVTLIFSLVLLFGGITYALYKNVLKGTTDNVIETGTLYFAYKEGNMTENGVNITNAFPISDDIGKVKTGANNYFDFSVKSKTTVGDLKYEVVVNKLDTSTMKDEYVKIYLTEIVGQKEIPSKIVMNNDIVKTYKELDNSNLQTGKIIYEGEVKNNSLHYQKDFRLRMWMSDNIKNNIDIYNKSFSVKVNVLGYNK